jgi:hypothetical protein
MTLIIPKLTLSPSMCSLLIYANSKCNILHSCTRKINKHYLSKKNKYSLLFVFFISSYFLLIKMFLICYRDRVFRLNLSNISHSNCEVSLSWIYENLLMKWTVKRALFTIICNIIHPVYFIFYDFQFQHQ